jgi:hypothetical protein
MRRLILIVLLLAGCDHSRSSSAQTRPAASTAPVPAMGRSTPTTHPAARQEGGGLHVAETNLWPLPGPVEFSLRGIWRYDPNADRWARVVKVVMPQSVTINPVPTAPGPGAPARRILEMPEQIGLYWVAWTENGRETGSTVFIGPISCNDVMIGEPPAGKIATCVPFANFARAQFVPDPRLHCK